VLFRRWSRRDILYFTLIGITEILIFFRNPGHFFMGDTLLWMGYRYHSIGDFFRGFVTVDPTLWYRPLAQRTVVSVLYPLFGLHPFPYHAVMFVLFFACTLGVFLVTEQLTESRRAAWIATLFFVPNVTHAFTTYDPAFVPEMMFTLFYVGSVIGWVVWLRSQNQRALVVSAALFVGSLLSKETAVALPFTLFVIWLCLPQKKPVRLRSLAPHFAILALYLVFAIGYLHIRAVDIRGLIERPGTAGQPGYELVLGKNVLESVKVAFSWAFGIPRGVYGQWSFDASWMLGGLRFVRTIILVAALLVLLTPRRKYLLIGIAWFLITAAPTLPLLDHFLPYYIFAPLIGLSIAVGAVLDWAYSRCAKYAPSLTFAACAALIAVVMVIEIGAVSRASADHFLLGGSAQNAQTGMNDMLGLFPILQKDTALFIFDEEEPSLYWEHAHGMLYQMAYGDKTIKTIYSSEGIPISPDDLNSGKAIVLKWTGGHLIDITSFVKQRPELLLPHPPDQRYHLMLSKSGVMTIPELHDVTLNVLRAYNGIIEEPFQVKLDAHGQTDFKLESNAKPGIYTFIAVQHVGEPSWVTVSGSIPVP